MKDTQNFRQSPLLGCGPWKAIQIANIGSAKWFFRPNVTNKTSERRWFICREKSPASCRARCRKLEISSLKFAKGYTCETSGRIVFSRCCRFKCVVAQFPLAKTALCENAESGEYWKKVSYHTICFKCNSCTCIEKRQVPRLRLFYLITALLSMWTYSLTSNGISIIHTNSYV